LNKPIGAFLLAILLVIAISPSIHFTSAYSPQKGDFFGYSETTTVNNGSGVYTGYSDSLQTSGVEQIDSVSGAIVSANYNSSYQYSSNQGSSTSGSSKGSYTWNAGNFTYVNGSDNQVGFGGNLYSKPLYVWFVMNPSLSIGNTFYVLNTRFAVLSKNYSLRLPTMNKYVQTIQTEGTGQYQRNDSYGVFAASYTWYGYFDTATGYIVGYDYVEQDNGNFQGQTGSFTYTDDLYVTSTSYSLTTVAPPTGKSSSITTTSTTQFLAGFPFNLGYILVALVLILIIIVIAIYAATRRRGKDNLPKHSQYTPPPTIPPAPYSSSVSLGSKPPEQVVIREVAKVNCKYCGTLIPSTADVCPYCGGPRQ
jgi:hypothetical protein